MEDTKTLLQEHGHEEKRGQRTPLYDRYTVLLKSLWGEKPQHNEIAHWIREKRKISNTDWVSIRTMKTT